MKPIVKATRLAVAEFLYDWRFSLGVILATAAVLAPLYSLAGLRFGIIDTLETRLSTDPLHRQMTPRKHGSYTPSFFKEVSAWPEVAFLMPETRLLSTPFNLLENRAQGKEAEGVTMMPTSMDDPRVKDLLDAPLGDARILLAERTAKRLGAEIGSRIHAYVHRRIDGLEEAASRVFTVVGVVPSERYAGQGSFVSLSFLVAAEDYREGYLVPGFTETGKPNRERVRSFARFRVFAREIFDVPALEKRFEQIGVEVRASSDAVSTLMTLDRNLSIVFLLILSTAAAGATLSLATILVLNVERKRKDLSVLRLIGVTTPGLVIFPVVQALLILGTSKIIALVWFFLFSRTLNELFAENRLEGESLCKLAPAHIGLGLLMALLLATLASAWAGRKIARMEPSEGLRDAV